MVDGFCVKTVIIFKDGTVAMLRRQLGPERMRAHQIPQGDGGPEVKLGRRIFFLRFVVFLIIFTLVFFRAPMGWWMDYSICIKFDWEASTTSGSSDLGGTIRRSYS